MISTEDFVAVQETTETPDHLVVSARKVERLLQTGLELGRGARMKLLEELDAADLVFDVLGVLERQVEKTAPERRQETVEPGLDRPARSLECERIKVEGPRTRAVQIPRKLIEHQDERLEFAERWIGRAIKEVQRVPDDRELTAARLAEVSTDDPQDVAARLHGELETLRSAERDETATGRRVPHLLASCRRAGLFDESITEPLGLFEHPLVRGTLRGSLPLTEQVF